MTRKIQRNKQFRLALRLALMPCIAGMITLTSAQANTFKSPDILMLGDSQLSFGTGLEMIRFFENFEARCESHVGHKEVLNKISHMRTTLIGARSTTLRSWSTNKGGAYDKLCKKDPNWGVNASIWGHMRSEDRKYIQIGETENFEFCKPSRSPIEAMYEEGYNPKLLLINILGNAAVKWAGSPKGAELDLKGVLNQLPEDLPCVYMTTMPTYTKKRNDRRYKAQNNLKKAMHKLGDRCTFVDTLDKSTIKAIQNKSQFFRKNEKGKVKDPFHPQQEAAELVLKMKEKQLCEAVVQAVLPQWEGQSFAVAEVETDTKNEVESKDIPSEAKLVNASLTKVDAPKTYNLEETSKTFKLDDAPKTYELEEVKVKNKPVETKVVTAIVANENVETSEETVKTEETEVEHFPIPVLVRVLPRDETIEGHKMGELVYVKPITSLDDKANSDLASVVDDKPSEQILQKSSFSIRGSLDLFFAKDEKNSKLLPITTEAN